MVIALFFGVFYWKIFRLIRVREVKLVNERRSFLLTLVKENDDEREIGADQGGSAASDRVQ